MVVCLAGVSESIVLGAEKIRVQGRHNGRRVVLESRYVVSEKQANAGSGVKVAERVCAERVSCIPGRHAAG